MRASVVAVSRAVEDEHEGWTATITGDGRRGWVSSVQAAELFQQMLLEARNGELFAPSERLLREARDERIDQLP